MKRRPFLHLTVGALATGGCLGAAEISDGSHPTEIHDGFGDITEMAVTDGGPLSVERVETFEYVVRLNDLGQDPTGGITAFEELDDRERKVAETAISEGYETRDAPEWLVKFASATPYIEREGTYYRLEHTFPTTTITAKAVLEGGGDGKDKDNGKDEGDGNGKDDGKGEVEGKVASYEEYVAAVTRDGYVMTGLMRIAREEGIDLTYVWPKLQKFLDTYDAVEYRGETLSFAAKVEDSGPPYEIDATRVSVSEAVQGKVWDASKASDEVRDLVRRAGRTSGAYGFGHAPDGFLQTLDDHQYVYLDGTFYTAYVEKRESVPVSLSASFEDGNVRLSLRNDADGELRIGSGAPRPFGVLRFHPVGDAADRRLLWTDAYVASNHVKTEGKSVTLVEDVGLTTTLAPGETVSETYSVGASDLSSGEYAVEDSVGVGTDGENGGSDGDGENGGTFQYRVVFSVA